MAIKSNEIKCEDDLIKARLENIVPEHSRISSKNVCIYEINNNGSIRELEKFMDIPSLMG